MFHFFVPSSKVQKDRANMRDTDARVAKYSRRGLVLNFIVFLLCLAFGDFQEREHNTAIVLITGLLLVTLWRIYYLFRFDALYARAPTRWRNQYFLASCIGAAWWSIILVTLTWVQGMRDETLIMWLYSVVFYSSVANVFAPYRHFLTLYLAIGQIPAAITAILLGDAEGILYGFIMLMFYVMLNHQGKVTSIAYWERLEANFSLRERAQGLENQQRSSQAQIELKNEFLVNIGQEFRASISDVLSTLSLIDDSQLSEHHRELLTMATKAGGRQIDLVNNVVDFSKITTKSLVLEQQEFDLRRVLEKFVQDFSLDAHQQGVELYYLFDPAMPSRVKGDVARMNQILATLLNHALKVSRIDYIFIEARFHQEQDYFGELQVIISDSERTSEQQEEDVVESSHRGIALSICKGLAECMGGSIHLRETRNRGSHIFINVSLQVVTHEERRFGFEQKLKGKRALLIDLPENNGHALADEISHWGMYAAMAVGQDQAIARLLEASKSEQPFDLVLIYTKLNNFNGLLLSRELLARPELADIKQVIAMSILQSDSNEMKLHLRNHPQVSVIEKPIMRKRLHDTMVQRLLSSQLLEEERGLLEREPTSTGVVLKVLLVEDHRVDQMVISAMLKKLNCYVQIAQNGLEAIEIVDKERFDLVLLDYDMNERDSQFATQKIRSYEQMTHSLHPVHIVAVTGAQTDVDQAVYLAAGMDDYISKPIRYDDLERRLARWFERE